MKQTKLITLKLLLFIVLALLSGKVLKAQGPGLVISEFLSNPSGTDSPFEFVEMVATRSINFASTPYTVIFTNNGTATANGWIQGGVITYAFEITSGSVNQGDVVYVGGSSMVATGTILRSINTLTTGGDGFGNSSSGPLGNGGGNADAIGIFDLPVASITNSTVPIDAFFFGTGIGSALVSGGTAGYELPINDFYSGGKLQSTSFVGADPGANYLVLAGTFNPVAGTFFGTRTVTSTATFTDLTTSIVISTTPPPASVGFAINQTSINENSGTFSIDINLTNNNVLPSSVDLTISTLSNAIESSDFTLSANTANFTGGINETVTVTLTLNNDALTESAEYLILNLTNPVNATVTGNATLIIYINDDETQASTPTNDLNLQLLTSFSNGAEGTNSAEIIVFDETVDKLYIANSIGKKLDILNFTNPASPSIITSIDITPYGNINSVYAWNGFIAAAVENINPQDSGFVVIFDHNGVFQKQVKVGAMPDMITMNHAHTKLITANEGEPNDAYTVDPNGSVCVIDISGGIPSLNQSNVTFIEFTAFNGQEALLRSQGIRIYSPGATTSKDFEPEYITVNANDTKAFVTLQENNAIAEINLTNNTITAVWPLGFKNHLLAENAIDFSDQATGINIANIPTKGMYLPDAIANYQVGGITYVLTANEGDARAYSGYNEETRIGSVTLDPTAFPQGSELKINKLGGRLRVTNALGNPDADGDFDELYSFGARSFSIWNTTTGAQVYDSGKDFEIYTSLTAPYTSMFNCSNTNVPPVLKDRSDDKGPEPEGVTTLQLNGHHYAIITLERIGGIFIYNIDNPAAPFLVTFTNNRDLATNGPDRGVEGVIFIPAAESPTGNDLVVLANEVSSTITVFQLNNCLATVEHIITPSGALQICDGNSVQLSVPSTANVTYQWYLNSNPISGATSNVYTASQSGDFYVIETNTTMLCANENNALTVVENANPIVFANSTLTTVCAGDQITLNGTGAQNYTWDNGVINNTPFTINTSTTFTVTGTDANNCSDNNSITINVNQLPNIIASTSANNICAGSSITLNGLGAVSYTWDNGVTNNSPFTINASQTYTVTGTDANNCSNSDQISINVYALPTVVANASDNSICQGESVILTGSGAQSYSWNNGVSNGVSFIPSGTLTYQVTGTDANNCSNTANTTITVNALPTTPTITSDFDTLFSSSALNYQWYWNGNLLNGETGDYIIASLNGNYTVEITDANGCSNTSNPYSFNGADINDLENVTSIKLYPNPFNTQLTIEIDAKANEVGLIEVFDAIGKIIYSKNINLSKGKQNITINNDELPSASGILFFKVSIDSKPQTFRIIKI